MNPSRFLRAGGFRSRSAIVLAIAGAALGGCSSRPSSGPAALAPTYPGKLTTLCVTEGEVQPKGGGRMEVADPAMRAVALGTGGDAAELEFTYEGPTSLEAPLGNGELRRQIGLKLRAADSCNVVYVMWRLEPSSGLAVSVKRNPGMSENAQCHDGGYHMVKSAHGEPVPSIRVGETHSLRAELNGDTLRVFADGRLAWEGKVGEEALAFDGPIGVRTDNGRFVFRVVGAPGGQPSDCRSGALVAAG
jgi:hypothetical protein